MTLHQLQIFVVAARRLSLTAAAAELHIAQPSVSQQLRLLEEEFGVRFHRKIGRHIELTDVGRLFLKDAKKALARIENLKKKFAKKTGNPAPSALTVGGTYGPSAILLPSLLAAFKEAHPNVEVNLLVASSRSVERKIVQGEVEVAVVTNVAPPSGVATEPYGTLKTVVFASKDHPIARKGAVTLADLAGTPLIIRGARGRPSTTERILGELKGLGFKPNIGMRCDSPDGVKSAVRKKLGLGVLYYDVVEEEIKRGDFKTVKIPGLNLDGKVFLIYAKDRPLSPNAQAFLELLRERREKL